MLQIDRDENLSLNGQSLSIDEVPDKFLQNFSENPQVSLILEADRRVSHGLVVRIMDLAKKTGIKKLVIATKVKSETEQ